MAKQTSQKASSGKSVSNKIMNMPLQELTSKVVYIVLLIAFLVIGYLLGSIFPIKGGQIAASDTTTPDPQAAAPAQPGAPAAPDPATVLDTLEMGHLPVKGQENAPVTIVEFSDFECPFCGAFYTDTLPQLTKDYIDTGKVKLYYRHFPLSFHPKAVPLAHASECANDQDAFWRMHDLIFDKNATVASMTDDQIKALAGELGLNTSTFNSCYDAKTHQAAIDEDMAAGTEVGVSGTPTFYINGRQLVGAQPFDAFKAVIDEELNK